MELAIIGVIVAGAVFFLIKSLKKTSGSGSCNCSSCDIEKSGSGKCHK
ncbi:MAG: hypothetical protein CSB55_08165 [Candidatus Cloacimonadota bacterium]|nr:MAG: hypothetical protein CSB55_08165 [Candidatus Cloacimonadota bacterium]